SSGTGPRYEIRPLLGLKHRGAQHFTSLLCKMKSKVHHRIAQIPKVWHDTEFQISACYGADDIVDGPDCRWCCNEVGKVTTGNSVADGV
ncbi:uncharacterized protein METZ01_LOCUS239356, partial [marine metagenome]